MANIANAISRNDCLNNNMKPDYDLAIRFEASGGLTKCWNAQANIGPDCCRAIDIITHNCWPAILTSLGFTTVMHLLRLLQVASHFASKSNRIIR
ncbi:hypothetical protein CUMW_008010 [Citrus unshiu]|nr:hypothetical protein CUMW_008010 [Citrus unshiu]